MVMGFHLKKFWLCSPVSPITNVLPLSLVLLVSLIKEAWEDWVSNSSLEYLYLSLQLLFNQHYTVSARLPFIILEIKSPMDVNLC